MKKFTFIAAIMITLMLLNVNATAQVTTPFNFGISTYYVGWNSFQNFPLNIIHAGPHPINFLTDSIQRATIMPTTGNVGIAMANPKFKLDVDSGGVNIHMYKNYGYNIAGFEVLKIHGMAGFADTTNIFGGIGAGVNDSTGVRNTCFGKDAGHSNKIESDETLIGYQAGRNTHSGPGNTMVGSTAGYSNTFGHGNVFEDNI